MELLSTMVRQRLWWKLFLSHLVIVIVGVVILAGTARIHAPVALAHHVLHMEALLADAGFLAEDLRRSFLAAVSEILLVAGLAASLAAAAASTFVAGRIVNPVRSMMQVSRLIAGGDYRQRVRVPGNDELAELALSFNRMAGRLEDTERRRRELIGDVAHELRTPLAGIRSLMEGLVDGVLPAGPDTFLDVQREVARLQRLVQDLEELSRAEAGRISLELQEVDPADLIHRAAGRLRPQFDDKGVTLREDIAGGLPAIRADPGRILQALLNLLGNALQYTPAGGRVTVRACRQGAEVIVAVEDTGIGVAAEHLPHLFERFYRVDRSRTRPGGGSGIGLTIAAHLVEAHGGAIRAESRGPGQGSTFTFTLPVAG